MTVANKANLEQPLFALTIMMLIYFTAGFLAFKTINPFELLPKYVEHYGLAMTIIIWSIPFLTTLWVAKDQ